MKFFRLIFVPLGFLCVLIVRLLARVGILIRFGEFFSARLGHLAGHTEVYLCEKDAGIQPKSFDIWVHKSEPASEQLARMFARVLHVDWTGFTRLVMLCNSCFPGAEKHLAESDQLDRDIHNTMEKYPPHLSFTDDELRYGHHKTKMLGIPSGAKWVYLIVRDDAKHPHLPYHSYRNADIDSYALAALWLADQGYYVVRMGKNVLDPMPVQHPKIIDFAMQHDDFMQVYLGAFCEFCISTGTGPDAIPYIFRRPICYTNYVPLEYLMTFAPKSLAIWKHHEKDGKRMSVAEIIESKAGQFMRADEFEEAKITLVDNTPEEILAVVKEMVDILECPYPTYRSITKDALPDQTWFWSQFPRSMSDYNKKPLHGELRMRIGSEFLRWYQ